MRWEPTEIGDLSGRTAVVTGANSGIGAATARELAGHGAHLLLAVRNTDAGQRVADEITAAGGSATVEHLDLASLDSVRDFAERVDRPVDILVNNGAIMATPRHRSTVDGHELQFGTNHLGHFALTGRLLPQLLAAAAPRVTTVSSLAHTRGDRRVLDGNPADGYGGQAAYAQSKLANLLFAMELQRRADAARSTLTSTAAHPGVSNTNLFRSPDGLGALFVVRVLSPASGMILPGPARGAEAILYAATVADPGSYTGPTRFGETRGPIGPARVSRWAQDAELAAELWARSEELTGVSFRL